MQPCKPVGVQFGGCAAICEGVAVIQSSGTAALQTIIDEPRLSLILIDNSLPDMNGFELVDAIRQVCGDPALPFAFFTASVRDNDLHRYASAGAIGVISKPFDPLTLAQTVRKLI